MAEACGFDAVVVHPRTAAQGFSGHADWSLIGRIKQAVSIPVIGNGDIRAPDDVLKMQQETGCDGVMIGRAAIGSPWIFTQILDRLQNRPVREPDLQMRFQTLLRYIDYGIDHFGESRAIPMMRSRVGWFTKGLPHSSRLREAVTRLGTREAFMDVIETYFDGLLDRVEKER